jgi:formylmethanofuran dehydrogenase subunit E
VSETAWELRESMGEPNICEKCGGEVCGELYEQPDGKWYCKNCDNGLERCGFCGEWIDPKLLLVTVDGDTYCGECYTAHYNLSMNRRRAG